MPFAAPYETLFLQGGHNGSGIDRLQRMGHLPAPTPIRRLLYAYIQGNAVGMRTKVIFSGDFTPVVAAFWQQPGPVFWIACGCLGKGWRSLCESGSRIAGKSENLALKAHLCKIFLHCGRIGAIKGLIEGIWANAPGRKAAAGMWPVRLQRIDMLHALFYIASELSWLQGCRLIGIENPGAIL